jgi:hypothetical protein
MKRSSLVDLEITSTEGKMFIFKCDVSMTRHLMKVLEKRPTALIEEYIRNCEISQNIKDN